MGKQLVAAKARQVTLLQGVGVVAAIMVFSLLFWSTQAPWRDSNPEENRHWQTIVHTAAYTIMAMYWIMAASRWIRARRQSWISACRKAFAQNPDLGQVQNVELTDEYFTVSITHSKTRLEWPGFIRMFETAGSFFLYTTPGAALILPKRAFGSSAEMDEFRGMAQARVGNEPGGFPVLPACPGGQPPVQPRAGG